MGSALLRKGLRRVDDKPNEAVAVETDVDLDIKLKALLGVLMERGIVSLGISATGD